MALVHFMVLGSRASNFLFEAMGAQLISGAQQILMVLGAQGVQGDQMAEGANGSPGSPDNSGAQTTREPRQLGSPGNSPKINISAQPLKKALHKKAMLQ